MLKIGDKVYGEYEIACFPYPTKDDAYADISAYWQGTNCTTYYDSNTNEWYIIN